VDQSDSTVGGVPILLFKPIASAKETAARGRRLRLRTVLQAAGAIALLAVAGFYGSYPYGKRQFLPIKVEEHEWLTIQGNGRLGVPLSEEVRPHLLKVTKQTAPVAPSNASSTPQPAPTIVRSRSRPTSWCSRRAVSGQPILLTSSFWNSSPGPRSGNSSVSCRNWFQ
jgi:hypothetical protein